MRDYERTTGQSAYTQVSGGMNFKEYFQNEMTDQQRRDWLGPEKFEIWKRGKLPLDSFIPPYPDRAMTVREMKRRDQESFAKVPILEKAKTDLSVLKPKEKTPEELKQEHKKKRQKQLAQARKNRLKREADLVGAKLIKGEHSIEDDLKATNPNFVQGRKGVWERNCQRCVTAYEMRRRGIDVEALPREADRDGFATLMKNGDLNPDGYIGAIYKNAKLVKIPAQTQEQCKTDIQNKMAEFGDGSRAIVRVRWEPENGHVFIAEQVNGQTRFIDPQLGREDVSWYFSQIKPAETCLIRVDNLKFDAKVNKCAKPR